MQSSRRLFDASPAQRQAGRAGSGGNVNGSAGLRENRLSAIRTRPKPIVVCPNVSRPGPGGDRSKNIGGRAAPPRRFAISVAAVSRLGHVPISLLYRTDNRYERYGQDRLNIYSPKRTKRIW